MLQKPVCISLRLCCVRDVVTRSSLPARWRTPSSHSTKSRKVTVLLDSCSIFLAEWLPNLTPSNSKPPPCCILSHSLPTWCLSACPTPLQPLPPPSHSRFLPNPFQPSFPPADHPPSSLSPQLRGHLPHRDCWRCTSCPLLLLLSLLPPCAATGIFPSLLLHFLSLLVPPAYCRGNTVRVTL